MADDITLKGGGVMPENYFENKEDAGIRGENKDEVRYFPLGDYLMANLEGKPIVSIWTGVDYQPSN
jgi:hypothetical protein